MALPTLPVREKTDSMAIRDHNSPVLRKWLSPPPLCSGVTEVVEFIAVVTLVQICYWLALWLAGWTCVWMTVLLMARCMRPVSALAVTEGFDVGVVTVVTVVTVVLPKFAGRGGVGRLLSSGPLVLVTAKWLGGPNYRPLGQ